ncbi:AfsR/SARP family transcriptional regulator [Micromonospora sp. WMMD998]|uniref:AfsR/SARP family transcriptional regulator n=1 Tax=Micromonospora sp. WMMD998 TaxID=3016092 RepID=UPI00249AF981|nr:AfsR/SARP family transcriptional regulator [Micromonospora sp. WMMD998]WFE42353.1 AfsR/SARP family transcriptional regulator [Micromonospora sp. WMMD998]
MSMRFGLLGPVALCHDQRQFVITSTKQRALLAALLLEPNRFISAERLAEAIWGEGPPSSAEGLIRTYAWRLRRLLDDERDRLVGRSGGYRLRVEPGELDTDRFARLAVRGQLLLRAGEPSAASEVLSEALAQWRGPLLADTELHGSVLAELGRLEELRLTTVEYRIDAELAVGRHRLAVPELLDLVARHPLRERLTAQLMVALYRSGRRAEALAAYAQAARVLRAELGLDPGATLGRLQGQVLRDDPALRLDEPPPADDDHSPAAHSLFITYGVDSGARG